MSCLPTASLYSPLTFTFLPFYFLIDLALNVVAELSERGDALHLLWNNLKTKVPFDNNHNIYKVQTVDAHVVLQTGIGENLFLINLQLINEECSYFFFNFFISYFLPLTSHLLPFYHQNAVSQPQMVVNGLNGQTGLLDTGLHIFRMIHF